MIELDITNQFIQFVSLVSEKSNLSFEIALVKIIDSVSALKETDLYNFTKNLIKARYDK